MQQDRQNTVFMVYSRKGKKEFLKWTTHRRKKTHYLNSCLKIDGSLTLVNAWLDNRKKDMEFINYSCVQKFYFLIKLLLMIIL